MIAKRLSVLFALAAVLSSASCSSEPATVNVQYLAGSAKYPAQNYITQLNQAPSGPYTQIAVLTATGSPGLAKVQLLALIQQKAEALGANAMIVTDESQSSAPSVGLSPSGGQVLNAPPQDTPAFSVLAIYVDQSSQQ